VNEFFAVTGRHEIVDGTVDLYSSPLTTTESITNHQQLDAPIEDPNSVVEETRDLNGASDNAREEEQEQEQEEEMEIMLGDCIIT